MTILIDIETRSRADLPEVGAYRYGEDPTTEILMMAVAKEEMGSPVHLWVNPKFESAGVKSDPEAMRLLRSATKVVAHNAPFEIAVMDGVKFDPFIPLDNWHCTAAMARVAGVAESLEKCADMLELEVRKDSRGKALIRRFSIPKEDGSFNEPVDFPEEWAEFCAYCRTDVDVERRIWHKLARFRLDHDNWHTWQFTLRMNSLGIPVNTVALKNAGIILDEVNRRSGEEFRQLTGLNITQRTRVQAWLSARGVPLTDMQADTLESVPTDIVKPEVARAIELYRQMSYAAVKKIDTMHKWTMSDGRMRGVFKFYGTGTGRWSAGGPQIQNAKKPSPAMRPITKQAYKAIINGATCDGIESVFGNPVEVIASCVRHFIDAGRPMLDADYNAIEARIACWVSGETEALREYRQGIDRYRLMAAHIFGKGTSAVTPDERDVGKQAILGLSYGMGAEKFQLSCEMKGIMISEDVAEMAKRAFREKHSRMTTMWWNLDRAIRQCAMGVTGISNVGTISVRVTNEWCRYLSIVLPSGRCLYYPKPEIDEQTEAITYLGQLPMSTQWGRIKLYGAKAFENICQAIAADLMSHGARTAEDKWMLPFALIHDQALAIQNDGQTPDQFAAALQQLPPWAHGLPLKAEAKLTEYYQK